MDIVEFAEKFYGASIPDWQRAHLRRVYELSKNHDIRVVMRKGQAYTYLIPKELTQNGQTSDSSGTMPVMR